MIAWLSWKLVSLYIYVFWVFLQNQMSDASGLNVISGINSYTIIDDQIVSQEDIGNKWDFKSIKNFMTFFQICSSYFSFFVTASNIGRVSKTLLFTNLTCIENHWPIRDIHFPSLIVLRFFFLCHLTLLDATLWSK